MVLLKSLLHATLLGLATGQGWKTLRPLVPVEHHQPGVVLVGTEHQCVDESWKWMIKVAGTSTIWVVKNPDDPYGAVNIPPPPKNKSALTPLSSHRALATCIEYAHWQGLEVLGYIDTKEYRGSESVGLRPMHSILADIDGWVESAPDIAGLYFDHVSGDQQANEKSSWGDHHSYYNHIFKYTRQAFFNSARYQPIKPYVVANSHGPIAESLVFGKERDLLADVVIVFDGTMEEWSTGCGKYGEGPFCRAATTLFDQINADSPANQFVDQALSGKGKYVAKWGAFVNNASLSDVPAIKEAAKKNNLEFLYVTHHTGTLSLRLSDYYEQYIQSFEFDRKAKMERLMGVGAPVINNTLNATHKADSRNASLSNASNKSNVTLLVEKQQKKEKETSWQHVLMI